MEMISESADKRASNQAAQVRSSWTRIITWVLFGLSIAMGLAAMFLVGVQREIQRSKGFHLSSSVLKYGINLPPFRLKLASGHYLDVTQLKGRWTLLVFYSPWCPACETELQALIQSNKMLASKLRIICVMTERPIIGSAESAGRSFQISNNLPFEVALDPDGRFASMCIAHGTPYSVLLDPDGKTRMAIEGDGSSPNGLSYVTEAMLAKFTAQRFNDIPASEWANGVPMPNISLTLQNGQTLSLASLSEKQPVIVTFLTGGDPSEALRVKAIRHYRSATWVKFLFVGRNKSAVPADLGFADGMLVSTENTDAAFQKMGIIRGPISFLFYRGREYFEEEGPQANSKPFDLQLAFTVLLSQPKGDSISSLHVNRSDMQ